MIRVVVIEDLDLVRNGIVRAVGACSEPPLEVVGQAGNVQQALKLSGLGFDVALVDLGLPDGSGVDVIRHFREHAPGAKCVVLTLMDDDASLFSALGAGAQGYLLKESKPRAIRDAIAEAHAGGVPLTPRMARFLVEQVVVPSRATERAASLSDREHEVLTSLANGLSYREVASSLAIQVAPCRPT